MTKLRSVSPTIDQLDQQRNEQPNGQPSGQPSEQPNEQLSLFAVAEVPERFRLDDATRRRGMRHVAELKALLEAKYPSSPSGRRRGGSPITLGARSTRSAA